MFQSMMTPVLMLVCWTLIMWLWMYATRIPAMQKAGLKPAELKEKSQLDVLPRSVEDMVDPREFMSPMRIQALGPLTALAAAVAAQVAPATAAARAYRATICTRRHQRCKRSAGDGEEERGWQAAIHQHWDAVDTNRRRVRYSITRCQVR